MRSGAFEKTSLIAAGLVAGALVAFPHEGHLTSEEHLLLGESLAAFLSSLTP